MKKVFCLRRSRSVRYCARREASRISRLRYICGGDEGSVARGSEGNKGVEDLESPGSGFSADGAGEGDLETTAGTEVPGGGAPLTI